MPGGTNYLNEITEDVQQKLSENGISTPQGFLVSDIENLIKITGMSPEEIKDLKIKVSRSIHKPNNILKAIDLVPWDRLSTGCDSIDRIIRGGIPLSGITEIYGYSGVGKTQLCLQLALQVQLSIEEGGLNKGAVYICTEDVFPTKRFHQMAQFFKIHHNLSNENLESNVFLKHASDITELTNCVSQELRNLLRRESIGLIVLDSIAGPFKGENEKELLLRSGDLLSLVEQLYVIQEEYPVAIVCTNQVTENMDGTSSPCLGVAWSNSINYRCKISRFSRDLRAFEVIFSPDVHEGKCYFHVTEEGLKSEEHKFC
ncbi:DNA repair protein XRCC3 isoform X2 [Diabrotica virgifera virgifera]|uniref:DNA repair protein XRCC3 isoform X2 n=1 Tax=Diabrotica virgifera virgifera TaxID=50390 RepID=A0A6P7FGL3_DIAVI|nr:DNA repair protein XRCC3 isoform X2 [Diabrotica virgifera virgifera]